MTILQRLAVCAVILWVANFFFDIPVLGGRHDIECRAKD